MSCSAQETTVVRSDTPFYLTDPVQTFARCNRHQHRYSFFLRVTGFLKTVSRTRLCRRFLPVGGASPSMILFRARGSGSTGLGRGEIRSASATGRGAEAALDLRNEGKTRWASGFSAGGVGLCFTQNAHLAGRLRALLVETPAALSTSASDSSEDILSWKKKRVIWSRLLWSKRFFRKTKTPNILMHAQ